MSKYDKLWNYVKENNLDCYKLSYDKIKEILGFDIDHSFLKYNSNTQSILRLLFVVFYIFLLK